MKVKITLHGCDDSTRIDMDISQKELELLERVAFLSKKESTYGCMPIMTVQPIIQHKEG